MQGTGLFWDEPLDLYVGGTINLNLYNNVLGFISGETISGTVDIEIGEPFEATNLLLEFKGVERCHMGGDGIIEIEDFHREVKEVISMKQVIVQFQPGETLQEGQYSYPFQIFTPSWLPESSLFKTRKDRFTVEYTLRAQFTPRNPALFVDHPTLPGKYWNVSVFRGSRKINIFQPHTDMSVDREFKLQIRKKFGLRLFGQTEAICDVKVNRNWYYPGEQIDVILDCDNSQCSKAIKSYKLKLFRQLRCRGAISGQFDTFVSLLKKKTFPGCAAQATDNRVISFDLPVMEKDRSEDVK